jgi:small subunit ribosomal protein S17
MNQAATEKVSENRMIDGIVTSVAMDRTVTVMVERTVRHPVYAKFLRRSTKLHAHDERNECSKGDRVRVEQCRPISKTKRWKLVSILEKAR